MPGFFGTESRYSSPLNILNVIKALGIAFVFTGVVFAVFALLITYTSMPDSIIGMIVFVTMIFAIMVSGFVVARNATSRGWLNGAVGGLLYVLILYIIGALFQFGLVFDRHVAMLLLIGFLAGAFGGIVGINMKKK